MTNIDHKYSVAQDSYEHTREVLEVLEKTASYLHPLAKPCFFLSDEGGTSELGKKLYDTRCKLFDTEIDVIVLRGEVLRQQTIIESLIRTSLAADNYFCRCSVEDNQPSERHQEEKEMDAQKIERLKQRVERLRSQRNTLLHDFTEYQENVKKNVEEVNNKALHTQQRMNEIKKENSVLVDKFEQKCMDSNIKNDRVMLLVEKLTNNKKQDITQGLNVFTNTSIVGLGLCETVDVAIEGKQEDLESNIQLALDQERLRNEVDELRKEKIVICEERERLMLECIEDGKWGMVLQNFEADTARKWFKEELMKREEVVSLLLDMQKKLKNKVKELENI